MLTVACVYRTGGEYNWGHVNKLVQCVRKNLTVPHKIFCLTNDVDNADDSLDGVVRLQHDWPGWWSKIELFKTNQTVLYFDLDTVIVNNIDALANWIVNDCDGLMMLKGFYRKDKCSGIMGWRQDLSWLYKLFLDKVSQRAEFSKHSLGYSMRIARHRYRGDQEWIRDNIGNMPVYFIQDIFTGVYSYKVHVQKQNGIPDDANIICFHGKPKPHEVPELICN